MKADAGIDVRAAWDEITAHVRPLGDESVGLESAVGRVLRAPVVVDRDQPPFPRAAMDGFAVRSGEVVGAGRATPVRLAVAGESTPGRPFSGRAPGSSAVRIMTGAALPDGFDAVVPVEETSGFGTDREVEIRAGAAAGQHYTARGRERRGGETLFEPGHRLRAPDVAALALVGTAVVRVGRRARVAVLSTGNELVPHDEAPDRFRIRNSNGPMLAALAQPAAADIERLGIAADRADALDEALRRGLRADLLLVTGGVSMGAYDLVGAALERAGVHPHFTRVALQPGRPTLFGTHASGVVLALPGNPVSALVTYRLFASQALARLEGEAAARPEWSAVDSGFVWERRHAKWVVLPARRTAIAQGVRVDLVPYAGSGDLLAYARADCQVVLPPDRQRVAPGEPVWVWPLD